MAGHIKKREWLDGEALSMTDPEKRAAQVREIKAQARAQGRKLGPIRVTYQARIPSPANRRKDLVKTFARRKDAERWLDNTAAALHRGDFIDPRRGDALFAVVVDEWRETWADLAPKTQVGYESILNRHLLPEFGRSRIAAVGPKEIQDFVNELAETHAPNTVRRVMDPLRNVLRVAVERRYIAANPCDAVSSRPRATAATSPSARSPTPRSTSSSKRCRSTGGCRPRSTPTPG